MNRARTLCPNTKCLSSTFKKKVAGNIQNKIMYKGLNLVQCQACGLDHEETKRPKYTVTSYSERVNSVAYFLEKYGIR